MQLTKIALVITKKAKFTLVLLTRINFSFLIYNSCNLSLIALDVIQLLVHMTFIYILKYRINVYAGINFKGGKGVDEINGILFWAYKYCQKTNKIHDKCANVCHKIVHVTSGIIFM